MSSALIISIIAIYFVVLIIISRLTSKGADNKSFFIGNKTSPWYIVAFGMLGASLSGVTFISVPGWVESRQFSYMQMVLGYLAGYFVIANILLPLYYRLNLTSIYSFLEQRFGQYTYKTGASFFLLSRTIGASLRLFLVANVLQYAVFDKIGIPFYLTVILTIVLIWLYTNKGGIKTIIWTDTLQTLFMLLAVGTGIYFIADNMNLGFGGLVDAVASSDYSQIFFFDDYNDKRHFIKQFLGGAFITITMTGLDQDMMQKNLSCRNLKDAKKNMYWFSLVLVPVNLIFMILGALLFVYATQTGITIPERTDDLFQIVALNSGLPIIVGIFFIIGLIAAAYSSADSALTSLTTSFTVDILGIKNQSEAQIQKKRRFSHIAFSVLLIIFIILFKEINNQSVIGALFTFAGYTYGPLLGLYALGLFTKINLKDKFVPIVAIAAPFVSFILTGKWIVFFQENYGWFKFINYDNWLGGYHFDFELILLNGLLTFMGLLILRKK